MAAKQCAYETCGRLVRQSETYCVYHGGRSKAELDAEGSQRHGLSITDHLRRRETARALRDSDSWPIVSQPPVPVAPQTPRDHFVEPFVRIGLHPDDVNAIVDSTIEVIGRAAIDVPLEAAKRRTKVVDIAKRLRERLGDDRVHLVRMSGLMRHTGQAVLRDPGVSHVVIVIDPKGPKPLLVDPFVAALAPVPASKVGVPVSQSGVPYMNASPYVDGLWIGSPQEYQSANGYMAWSQVVLERGDR